MPGNRLPLRIPHSADFFALLPPPPPPLLLLLLPPQPAQSQRSCAQSTQFTARQDCQSQASSCAHRLVSMPARRALPHPDFKGTALERYLHAQGAAASEGAVGRLWHSLAAGVADASRAACAQHVQPPDRAQQHHVVRVGSVCAEQPRAPAFQSLRASVKEYEIHRRKHSRCRPRTCARRASGTRATRTGRPSAAARGPAPGRGGAQTRGRCRRKEDTPMIRRRRSPERAFAARGRLCSYAPPCLSDPPPPPQTPKELFRPCAYKPHPPLLHPLPHPPYFLPPTPFHIAAARAHERAAGGHARRVLPRLRP